MLFEGISIWDTIVNYNNYFRQECYKWLLNNRTLLAGFDANGQSVVVEADESYFHVPSQIPPRSTTSWSMGR